MKIKKHSLLASALVAVTLSTTITPLAVFADTVSSSAGGVPIQIDDSGLAKSSRSKNDILASLAPEKAQEWKAYFEQNHISVNDQLNWLQYEDGLNHQIQPRWKAWLVEQALKLAAKQAGKAASGALIEKWAAKISGTEAAAQNQITRFLISLGVNKTAAKIIAKGVMIVLG